MIILTLTVAGSVSFALIYLVSRLLASSLSHKLRYYALLVPVLLFLIPVASCFSVTVTRTPYMPDPVPAVVENTAPLTVDTAAETDDAAFEIVPASNETQGVTADTLPPADTRKLYLSPALIINMIWLLGAAAALSICVYRRRGFCRRLKKAVIDADGMILERYEYVCRDMAVSRPPELKQLDARITPFITGIFRPQIVVPTELDEERIDCVLRHELTHYKRRDLWFKQLTELICILHWFNPAAYLLRRCADTEMELSCDERVSAAMAQTEKVLYGKSILMLMHAQSHQYSAALSESSENIKQRLEVIMQNNKTYSKITAALTAAAMLTISLVSASAAGSISSKSENGVYSITDTASVYFSKEDTPSELITGNGLGERKVTLVNTPFYKSFHAEIKADTFYPEVKLNDGESAPSGQFTVLGSNGHYTVDPDSPTGPVSFEVSMKSLSNTVDNGRTWVGSFTLTQNGAIAFDDVPGTLTNVPGAQKELCDLDLDLPDDFGFSMSFMNFDLEGDTAVEYAYTQDSTERSMSESSYYKCPQEDGSYRDYTSKPVKYDESKGLLSNLWLDYGKYNISASLDERYSFSGSSVSGNFLLKKYNTPIDEVRGTLTGFNGKPGEKMTFRSEDGSITAEALLVETPNDVWNPAVEERRYWGLRITDEFTDESDKEDSRFAEEADICEANRPMQLSDFPFDIKLSEDRQSVTLTQKPDHAYEYWEVSMATYNSMYRWNIFEMRRLAEHGSTITFPVYNNGCRHYLNFSGYNTANGAEVRDCELQFQLNNNELVFLQMYGSHFLNTNYKGDEAREKLLNHPNTAGGARYAITGQR